jgi:hypothetical protein
MVKRKLKEKDITEYLHTEGFKKVGAREKKTGWYKKASEKPECLSKKKVSVPASEKHVAIR